MRLDFHPKVFADMCGIMEHYEDVATLELADEFYQELRLLFEKAADNPDLFARGSTPGESATISLPFFIPRHSRCDSHFGCSPSS